MRATYVDFTCDILKKEAVGTPIYTNRVAQQLGTVYQLDNKRKRGSNYGKSEHREEKHQADPDDH